MHKSEFVFWFLFRKKAKGTRVFEFCFSFCRGKKKGNMPRGFNFSFPCLADQSKIKSAEILFRIFSWTKSARTVLYMTFVLPKIYKTNRHA